MVVPRHVGLIPDGNRRWAKKSARGFFTVYGEASENLLRAIRCLFRSGVSYVSFYGFSLKNFERSDREKGIIFSLIRDKFQELKELVEELGVRVHFAGRLELFPPDIRKKFSEIESLSRGNRKGTLIALVGYDGNDELDYAVARMKERGGSLRENMFVPPEVPPVDLLIRTSGEKRLSGFLPYLTGYAELYFSEKLWPDFTEADLKKALEWYASRERRFGR